MSQYLDVSDVCMDVSNNARPGDVRNMLLPVPFFLSLCYSRFGHGVLFFPSPENSNYSAARVKNGRSGRSARAEMLDVPAEQVEESRIDSNVMQIILSREE